MRKSTKENLKNYEEYLRVHNFSSLDGAFVNSIFNDFKGKKWKFTIFIKTEETTFSYIAKMSFHAWHRVCSTERLASSVTEVLAMHRSCCGDGGNSPLSCMSLGQRIITTFNRII